MLDVVRQGPAALRYYVHTPSGLILHSIDATTGARRFYHYSVFGHTSCKTDDAGAVVAACAYTPYGEMSGLGEIAGNDFTIGGAAGLLRLARLASAGYPPHAGPGTPRPPP